MNNTAYLKNKADVRARITLPKYDPEKATKIKAGIKMRCSFLKYPRPIYTAALLASTPKSMAAEVAIKTFFSNSNATRVSPRIAPPVPINPAKKPETVPPAIKLKLFLARKYDLLNTK